MKKPIKITLWSLLGVLVLFIVASLAAGMYMEKYALRPDIDREVEIAMQRNEKYPLLNEWIDSLQACGILRDTSAIDDDGFEIHAYYAKAQEPSTKTAIVVHGYTSNPLNMMMIARMYRDSLGYNVLLPHLNYHMRSEGVAVQMGWKDRLDVENTWIPLAHDTFKDDLMVVHGISMGGATTMMVSGDELPPYVRGFVDDCGYTSVWDQFEKELKGQFGLPAFPILHAADLVVKCKYGWGFKEASSVNQLAKCDKPMLFIHGDSDDYVLTSNVYENYDAKVNGYKEMWVVPDTDHGNSYRNHPAEYTARVRAFLKDHVE